MRGFIAETFEHVRVPTRKVPDVAGIKVVCLSLPGRVDDRCAHTSSDHERPLGGSGVPVKLAHHTRLKLHRDACDSFRDWQLLDCHFLAKAFAEHSALRFLQFEFESRQFFSGQQQVGNVVLETDVGHNRTLSAFYARQSSQSWFRWTIADRDWQSSSFQCGIESDRAQLAFQTRARGASSLNSARRPTGTPQTEPTP